jgi:hypothetical protein
MHPAQEPEQLPSASLWRQDTLPHAPGPLAPGGPKGSRNGSYNSEGRVPAQSDT